MVGYRTSHPEMDGKYRKISVKVAGQGNVDVHSRKLTYRPKVLPDAKPTDAVTPSQDQSLSMAGLLPDLDVSFNVSALPFANPDGGSTVAIVTELAEPVVRGTSRVVQKMSVRTLVYDESGAVRSDTTTDAALDASPTVDEALRYAILSRLNLAPGHYDVRLVARNGRTDKLGSNEFHVVVPDFAHEAVSLSGVALLAPALTPSIAFGSLDGLLPATPSAVRVFNNSDKATAFVRVHQAASAPSTRATLAVQILDAAGEAIFDAVETMPSDRFAKGGAEYQLPLPLDRLRGGAYLLTMQATVGSHHSPRRDIRFSVR
jgi:hypothetical protein